MDVEALRHDLIVGLHEGTYWSVYMGGCQNCGPFWIPTIIRHLIFRVPKKDRNFDNHPYTGCPFGEILP